MELFQNVYELGKQYTPRRSGLHVIELPTARFDQWHHAGKPLAKLRQGEDLGYTTLPLGQTVLLLFAKKTRSRQVLYQSFRRIR
jgi:hypothetical protein